MSQTSTIIFVAPSFLSVCVRASCGVFRELLCLERGYCILFCYPNIKSHCCYTCIYELQCV